MRWQQGFRKDLLLTVVFLVVFLNFLPWAPTFRRVNLTLRKDVKLTFAWLPGRKVECVDSKVLGKILLLAVVFFNFLPWAPTFRRVNSTLRKGVKLTFAFLPGRKVESVDRKVLAKILSLTARF